LKLGFVVQRYGLEIAGAATFLEFASHNAIALTF